MAKYLLIVILFVLAGCSGSLTVFKGKSETWSVACTVDQSSKKYTIRYVGKKGQAIENVSFSFLESKNFNENGTSEGTKGSLKMSGSSTLTSPYVDEDRFKLTIKWNDKEETIPISKE